MPKKQSITEKEIIYDIKKSRKLPKRMTRSTYIIASVVGVMLGISLGFLSFFNQPLATKGLIAAVVVCLGGAIVTLIVRYVKSGRAVRIEDYTIVRDTLSHSEKERHVERRFFPRHVQREEVLIYIFYFESGKRFRLPTDNYLWDKERPMSDFFLYESCHRGDEFFLVIHRESGEIAAVYPTMYFAYKEI